MTATTTVFGQARGVDGASARQRLSVTLDRTGQRNRLRLAGALVAGTLGQVIAAAQDEVRRGAHWIWLDLAGVTWIDNAMLGELAQLHRELHSRGRRLVVTGVQPQALQAVQIATTVT